MSHWQRFCSHFVRYEDPAISLDISRMNFPDDFFTRMEPLAEKAMKDMQALEAGAVANPDEKRMVGHYWLRQPVLAPTPEIRARIEADIVETQAFADAVHAGRLKTPAGEKFTDILVIGIGGSALGPQLVSDALTDADAPMGLHFFDNTDPDGMARTVRQIEDRLSTTLSVVISKSGGTPETRNGMLQARAAYEAKGLDFGKHTVAVTGVGSQLDKYAEANGFIRRFPMQDWVGGRTSVMHTVGMVPAALQGVDVAIFLAGAAAMDAETRKRPVRENLAMLLALMWHHAGGGRGAKDMVVLPYKDRLVLLSKYLQQLVMESIGKKHDLDGKEVHQGIAVYGNKGSTDQHAYVQQLRDGVNNFFATFIEVRSHNDGPGVEVEPGANSADFLQGFLRGTRRALFEQDRENVTISLEKLDTYSLGAVIALFERAVGFYASLVNINAYHQPGVEAGKKAAGEFLSMLAKVRAALAARSGPGTAEQIAADAGCDPEDAWHALNHLAATAGVRVQPGANPAQDSFTAA